MSVNRCLPASMLARRVISAVLGLALASPSLGADYTATEVAQFYLDTAFKPEMLINPELDGKLLRFDIERPINVVLFPGRVITTSEIDDARNKLAAILQDLTRHSQNVRFKVLSDLDILSLPSTDARFELMQDNTLLVYTLSEAEIVNTAERLGETSVFAALLSPFHLGRTEAIHPICFGFVNSATVVSPMLTTGAVVAEYLADDLTTCLYEELMQIFGITGDFPARTESMFNDDRVHERPTRLDWLLWSIHTDARMQAGMGREEARPIAEVIAAELLASP